MMMLKPLKPIPLVAALALLLTAAAPGAAVAADMSPPPEAAAADPLAKARARIDAKNWAGAIDELKKVNDTGSADWNNLMGYSHRKAKTPDYAAAERYYNEALRIDAKHKGALEYSGELYLMLGDLGKAEARLAALGQTCGAGCGEYKDLKAEIDRFKANGNKFAAKP